MIASKPAFLLHVLRHSPLPVVWMDADLQVRLAPPPSRRVRTTPQRHRPSLRLNASLVRLSALQFRQYPHLFELEAWRPARDVLLFNWQVL